MKVPELLEFLLDRYKLLEGQNRLGNFIARHGYFDDEKGIGVQRDAEGYAIFIRDGGVDTVWRLEEAQ